MSHLKEIAKELREAGLGGTLGVDFGEVRGGSYYTGVSFSILGHGPGDPIVKGGRYDGLLKHYGSDTPATGFAINTHHLQWALTTQKDTATKRTEAKRIALSGFDLKSLKLLAEQFRKLGTSVCVLYEMETVDLRSYAKAWGFDGMVYLEQRDALLETKDGSRTRLSLLTDEGLAEWLQALSCN